MNKIVNNKSFDEIFKQKGIRTKFDEMEFGKIYLLISSYCDWDWICEFHSVISESLVVEIVVTCSLFSSGREFNIYPIIDKFGFLKSQIKYIYAATPDQIDLLNSYKYEHPAED